MGKKFNHKNQVYQKKLSSLSTCVIEKYGDKQNNVFYIIFSNFVMQSICISEII